MRNEFKMLIAGFGAGAVVGLIALTHVSASIGGHTVVRADRLALAAKRPIAYGDTIPHGAAVMLAANADGVVEWRDPRGRLIYQADRSHAQTSVAKGVAIPQISVAGEPD
jgi:hypothetical protein